MTAVADSEAAEEHPDLAAHAHPPMSTYWLVGLVLALLTALEVSTYWWPDNWSGFVAVMLMCLMTIKFALVALFFMHLRFDDRVLRRIFFFGLALALAVYLVTLSVFVFWEKSGDPAVNFPDPPYSKPVPPPPTDAPAPT